MVPEDLKNHAPEEPLAEPEKIIEEDKSDIYAQEEQERLRNQDHNSDYAPKEMEESSQ